MGKKIFVTYKYHDNQVKPLSSVNGVTTVRNYVDKLENLLSEDHVYKGENDGEDMSTLQDTTISSKLGDKIFDSTITVVLISKGMNEINVAESDQWIPWEISYSLKEQTRSERTSKTNAILAVVLPDGYGAYDYFITDNPACKSRTLNTNFLFEILKENMFNRIDKDSNTRVCNGSMIYEGSPSYIYSVKWEDFIINIDRYLNIAIVNMQNISQYNMVKTVP